MKDLIYRGEISTSMQQSITQNRARVINIVTETLTMVQVNKKYFLSTYHVLGTVPGIREKGLSLCPWGEPMLSRKDNKLERLSDLPEVTKLVNSHG